VLHLHPPGYPAPHNPWYTPQTSYTLTMFYSPAVVVCALSLLSSTHALAFVNRQSDCGFVCPEVDTNGNGLSIFAEVDDTSFSCTFSAAFESPCTYDSVSYDSVCSVAPTDLPLTVLRRAGWRQLGQQLPPAGDFSVPRSSSPRLRRLEAHPQLVPRPLPQLVPRPLSKLVQAPHPYYVVEAYPVLVKLSTVLVQTQPYSVEASAAKEGALQVHLPAEEPSRGSPHRRSYSWPVSLLSLPNQVVRAVRVLQI